MKNPLITVLISMQLSVISTIYGQYFSAKYCNCETTSVNLSKDSADPLYFHTDTAVFYEFKTDGTYVEQRKKYTQTYRPSTRKVSYNGKSYLEIKGTYTRKGKELTLNYKHPVSQKKEQEVFKMDLIIYHTGRQTVIWQENGNKRKKYSLFEYFQGCNGFQHEIEKLTPIIKTYTESGKSDTAYEWHNEQTPMEYYEIAQKKFFYPGIHFSLHTYTWYESKLNFSIHDTVNRFDDKHVYIDGILKKYFYKGNNKDSLNNNYYEIEYELPYYYKITKITDHSDSSTYWFVYEGKLFTKIEHYDAEGKLKGILHW